MQILFAQTDAEAEAQTAERIAKCTATEADRFIVVRLVAAKDGRPVQCRERLESMARPHDKRALWGSCPAFHQVIGADSPMGGYVAP